MRRARAAAPREHPTGCSARNFSALERETALAACARGSEPFARLVGRAVDPARKPHAHPRRGILRLFCFLDLTRPRGGRRPHRCAASSHRLALASGLDRSRKQHATAGRGTPEAPTGHSAAPERTGLASRLRGAPPAEPKKSAVFRFIFSKSHHLMHAFHHRTPLLIALAVVWPTSLRAQDVNPSDPTRRSGDPADIQLPVPLDRIQIGRAHV